MAKLDLLNLQETKISSSLNGKVLLIYSTNNCGKSKVSSQLFPHKTLFVATEKGYNALGGITKVDTLDWNTFRDIVSSLTNKKTLKEMHNRYECVVIDVADRLPAMCEQYICSRNGVEKISDIAYGGGYSQLKAEFDNQLNKLALSGYCVILICHEQTNAEYVVPTTGETIAYTFPKNTESKTGMPLKDIPDFCIYLQNNGTDENGEVVLSTGICSHRKNVFARSRFTQCATTIEPFTAENLKKVVRDACIREAELLGVECVDEFDVDSVIAEADAEKEERVKDKNDLIADINRVGRILYKTFSVECQSIITKYLGEGVKVSEATDEQFEKLKLIYNDMIDLAEKNKIEIEE